MIACNTGGQLERCRLQFHEHRLGVNLSDTECGQVSFEVFPNTLIYFARNGGIHWSDSIKKLTNFE
jgi:hypothetical protein